MSKENRKNASVFVIIGARIVVGIAVALAIRGIDSKN